MDGGPKNQQGERCGQGAPGRGHAPWYYRPTHPEARLSKEDKAYLIDGLEKTFSGQTEEKK
jgi:hypothetical protein